MDRWEYMVTRVEAHWFQPHNIKDVMKHLNLMGDNGWEMVTMYGSDGTVDTYRQDVIVQFGLVVWKRKVQQ
jgi:hypothetical protein